MNPVTNPFDEPDPSLLAPTHRVTHSTSILSTRSTVMIPPDSAKSDLMFPTNISCGSSLLLSDEFKSLVNDIESSHISCSSIIRKIRDAQLASTGASSLKGIDRQQLLPDLLRGMEERAENHKRVIESMCHQQYQGFVAALHQLLSLEQGLAELRKQLADISHEVQLSTQRVAEKCEQRNTCQETISNIDKAIEDLQLCLPILDQFSRVKKNISENRFFPALKLLGFLEHSQLPLISHYDFSNALAIQIPQIRELIKSKSERQHKDFLESVRKHSVRLGAMQMSSVAEKIGMRLPVSDDVAVPPPARGGGGGSYGDNLEREFELALAMSEELSDGVRDPATGSGSSDNSANVEEMVDFGPVYRCLHIHSVLGERAAFEKQYRLERRKQWQLAIVMSPTQQAAMRNYCEFFSGIVGFFVVEEYVMHTLPNMVDRSALDELWTETATRLCRILTTNVASVTSTELLLRLKDTCVLFTRTMQYFTPGHTLTGSSTTCLKPLVEVVRLRYHTLLTEQWRLRFTEIFQSDDYSAIQLQNNTDYSRLLQLYPCCRSDHFEARPFPKSVSFSWMVPRLYQALRQHIEECARFSEHLDLSHTEREDLVNKATNALLSTALKQCMGEAVRRIGENLLQLVQLSINMDELEAACFSLEEFIQHVLLGGESATSSESPETSGSCAEFSMAPGPCSTSQIPRTRLHGMSLFKDTRSEAESQIYSAINSKIDNFFSLANYDWFLEVASAGHHPSPQVYITDLVGFLEATFHSFDNIPPKVAQTACLSSCNYISQQLTRMLLSPDLKAVSEAALQQFSVDVSVCEEFARREPVPGVDGETLIMAFLDLRQLLDLVLREDFFAFVSMQQQQQSSNDSDKGNPYNRVSPGNVIKLLEKLKEADKRKSSLFHGMRKAERDKRKKIDDALKQLKELQQMMYNRQ